MTQLVAVDYVAGKALFATDKIAVIVDINNRDVVETPPTVEGALVAGAWMKVSRDFEFPEVWKELADAAVTSLEIAETPVVEVERKFRVPLAVKQEAERAIQWVHGFERGSSTLGMQVANQLANDNFITASRVARIARYFARRPASITENAGWSDGQQGYPSNERIRYSLWGGEPAREWVNKIAAKHPIMATGAVPPEAKEPPAEGEPEIDPNEPHEFLEDPDIPGDCLICGREEDADTHAQATVTASAFDYDDTCDYFGVGVDPDSTKVTGMYMRRPDGTWALRKDNDWHDSEEPEEDVVLIMLDPDSAQKLADVLDDVAPDEPDVLPYELAMLNPHEAALYYAAEPEIDWTLVDRVFDIYDSQERSVNAKKQVRSATGQFVPQGKESSGAGTVEDPSKKQPVARLSVPGEVIADVGARIDQYLLDAEKQRNGGEAQPETTTASAELAVGHGPVTDVKPLYLAIVDAIDTQAVLDLVALVPPPQGQKGDVSAWRREAGEWVPAPQILADLRGVTPPPVVEIKDDTVLKDVVSQVDAATEDNAQEEAKNEPTTPAQTETDPNTGAPATPAMNPDQHPPTQAASALADNSEEQRKKYAQKGYALPDGSYPIVTVADLKNAIQAFGRASNKAETKRHIVKRAKALGRRDLIPESWGKSYSDDSYRLWGPHGELVNLTAAGGVEVTPSDVKNTERLRQYWTHGEGAAKIQWGVPGDWYRCVQHLSKYLGTRAKGYCTLRHHDALGVWPGQEDGNH